MDDGWAICATCGVERVAPLPADCPICADERQYVAEGGQRWTTLDRLRADGHRLRLREAEPGRAVVTTDPAVGIGQSMQVVTGDPGSLVWDPVGLIDDATVAAIRARGPVLAVAASHPHMFGVQVEWARALEAPVLVAEADRQWIGRPDPSIEVWSGSREVGPFTLLQVGGHFPGSAVALWPDGAAGAGTLLTGDSIFPNPDRRSLGFLRSYPNKIPLSAAVVRRIADSLRPLRFDAVIGNFDNAIATGGHAAVQSSAERHIAWVRGDFDALT